jgi:hypothetical protein
MHYNVFVMGGIIIVALVAFDVFQSIIVPRVTPKHLRIAPFLVGRVMWPIHKTIGLALPEAASTQWFAIFAPVAYVVLLVTWLFSMIGGFGLVLYGLRDLVRPPITDFPEALYFASTSFLTLGFGDLVAYDNATRVVVISAAMLGLIFMALEISFLFTLQNYLQAREQTVNTLLSRAGSPASGVVLLLRYRELGIVSTLGTAFVTWEAWLATILESHLAFPMLIYFRSSFPRDSWLSTMGAVLDASTLISTTLVEEKVGEAELFYWLGTTTLKSICAYLDIKPITSETVSREEFELCLELLGSAGYKVKPADDCMTIFLFRRSGYMRFLLPLANSLALPLPVLVRKLPIAAGATQQKASRPSTNSSPEVSPTPIAPSEPKSQAK